MPNTGVASFDDAFDMDEPARRKPPRPRQGSGKRSGRKGGKKASRFRLPFAFDGRRVVRWLAVGMSGSLVVAITVNALVLQKGHHPAPLFGKAIALGPGPTPVAKAPPEQRPVPEAGPEAAEAPPAPHERTAMTEPAPSGSGDPIGALIEGHAPPPATKADTKTVLGAQKALAKLGFALKPTGAMGPQTRKAIETFERDRHLPVKGELTRRVVKILAAESGVRID